MYIKYNYIYDIQTCRLCIFPSLLINNILYIKLAIFLCTLCDQEFYRKRMWIFGLNGKSGFSARSTAEQVTKGVDGTGLVAIVTGIFDLAFAFSWIVLKNCYDLPLTP